MKSPEIHPVESPAWHKFDGGLQSLYSDYLLLQSGNSTVRRNFHPALKSNPDRVYFSLEFTGELSVLEAAGFQTSQVMGEGLATGSVALAQLAAFSQHPQVRLLRYGHAPRPLLDSTVADIGARGSGKVWDVNLNTQAFTGLTGNNVIIGILDTGIDWTHRNFLEINEDKTRILALWDMGLVPEAGEHSPDASLLYGPAPAPYGVEYTKEQIDAVWAGTAPASSIRHRDCYGHGTAVAGVAAGNGSRPGGPTSPRFEYCGVAPEARIIVVNLIDFITQPNRSPAELLKDAMSYVLGMAARQRKDTDPPGTATGLPVVFSCSLGNSFGPRDGFDTNGSYGEHSFLNATFKDQPGRACVFAAGNEAGFRLHATLTIPPGGTLDVPLEVYDPRTFKQMFLGCTLQSGSFTLTTEVFYPPVPGVTAALKTPGGFFSTAVALDGPSVVNQFYDVNKTFSLHHQATSAPREGTTDVHRNRIAVEISPHDDSYKTGTYHLRLKGPAGTVLQLWGQRIKEYGIRLPLTVPAGVDVNDRHTVGAYASAASVIGVGAYQDTNKAPDSPDMSDYLSCFSSQGPLADYTGTGPAAEKPDLVAPGVHIYTVRSPDDLVHIKDVGNLTEVIGQYRGVYLASSGTSFSAPHVAGVVALMLQKKPTLSQTEIKQILLATARPRPKKDTTNVHCAGPHGPSADHPQASRDEAGAGKVDAAAAVQAVVP